jgi:hypothetical protein
VTPAEKTSENLIFIDDESGEAIADATCVPLVQQLPTMIRSITHSWRTCSEPGAVSAQNSQNTPTRVYVFHRCHSKQMLRECARAELVLLNRYKSKRKPEKICLPNDSDVIEIGRIKDFELDD